MRREYIIEVDNILYINTLKQNEDIMLMYNYIETISVSSMHVNTHISSI